MNKLLKLLVIVAILFSAVAIYKNIVNKKTAEKILLSNQIIIKPGDYTRDLTAWPNRPYDLHVPSGFDASRPIPIVLALHGGGTNSENAAKLTCPNGNLNSSKCLNKLADREGFVVIYPNGTPRPLIKNMRTWNAGGGENGFMCVSEYACEKKIDDISYFKDLLSDLSKMINVDRARVYSIGMSNGAAMSHRLACELSDWIIAIAAISGGNQFSATAQCNPSKPVSILQIHGTSDPAWPYSGGPSRKLDGNFYAVSSTVSGWILRNKCWPKPIRKNMANIVNDSMELVNESYGNCQENVEVTLITINGGGHTWPQGNQYLPEKTIGKTSQDFNANETVWQFLKDHPRKN